MDLFQRSNIHLIVFLCALCQTDCLFSQGDLLPIEISRTPTYSEAPIIDTQGNIYVSEPYRGPIIKISSEGDTTTWAKLEGPNGHRILEDGTHLVCAQKAIIKLNSDGIVIEKVATTCGNEILRSPNDLTLDKQGGFYFTDNKDFEPKGRVCYVDSKGESKLVAEYDDYTNGIALSPDGKRLFVASSFNNEILAFPIESQGKVGPHEVFSKLPVREDGEFVGPDGILVNDEGKLYVAHFGMGKVHELNPKGHLIRSFLAGQKNCSNIIFGGPDKKSLFITGSPGEFSEGGILYKIEIK